jgi:DNA gyrase subunit B
MSNIKQYDASAIDVLNGLEAIRKRPDMYIGPTSGQMSDGLYRLCREAIDNSLDEYLGGFNKQLYIFYNTKTFETVVLDNGRGIPVGYSAKAKMDALTACVTKIHAGGKFDHDVYKTSSGKNGVGITALNALSQRLQIWSNNSKNGKWHTQVFEHGAIMSDVLQNDPPKEYMKLVPKTGTILKWTPDSKIFKDGLHLDINRLEKELNDIQYLCPNIHIHMVIDGKETEFYSEDGLAELVAKSPNDDCIFTYSDDFTDVAVNFTKGDFSSFKSFVNICYTNLGGTHLAGLRKTITDFVKTQSKQKLINDDILEGVIGVIHHRMPEPQYSGQTKNELTNTGVDKEIQEKLTPALEKFFKKNKDVLKRIVTVAEKLLEQRNKMKNEKDLLKGLKELNSASRFISDKFLDADRRKWKNPKDLELFIVEGDSAGGHFKQARESFQGELKLRGKPINAQSKKPEDLFGKPGRGKEEGKEGNREIKDLVAALGCGLNGDYDESKLRFNKVIILADSDVDGQHIQCLVLAFFVKYMPDLIKNGHVYIIDAPLFVATGAKQKVYGMARAEVDNKMKKLKCSDYIVSRLKGWGECNAELLSELCLNPKTRKLIQIKWTPNLPDVCEQIMGKDSQFRKELLGVK